MDSKKTTTNPYAAEFRERAVQMVVDHLDSYASMDDEIAAERARAAALGLDYRRPGSPAKGADAGEGAASDDGLDPDRADERERAADRAGE
mgnify:CR=1 FL=1